MNKEEIDESPYCEVCGTCGCIGCCGIRNFISEHIEGKTNCKNEGWIIQELINLCEYKDEVFKENKRLNNIIDELEEHLLDYLEEWEECKEDNEFVNGRCLMARDVLHDIQELKGDDKSE